MTLINKNRDIVRASERYVEDMFWENETVRCMVCFFFFQAEDGIRDVAVTGVQTCALPICDIEAARATLVGRGVEVAPVEDLGGVFYASFADPDGNTWTTPAHAVASVAGARDRKSVV